MNLTLTERIGRIAWAGGYARLHKFGGHQHSGIGCGDARVEQEARAVLVPGDCVAAGGIAGDNDAAGSGNGKERVERVLHCRRRGCEGEAGGLRAVVDRAPPAIGECVEDDAEPRGLRAGELSISPQIPSGGAAAEHITSGEFHVVHDNGLPDERAARIGITDRAGVDVGPPFRRKSWRDDDDEGVRADSNIVPDRNENRRAREVLLAHQRVVVHEQIARSSNAGIARLWLLVAATAQAVGVGL